MNGENLNTTCRRTLYPTHLISSSCLLVHNCRSDLFCIFFPMFVVTRSNVNMVPTVGGARKRKEITFLWSLWSGEISTNAEG